MFKVWPFLFLVFIDLMRLTLHNLLFDDNGEPFKIVCTKKRIVHKDFDSNYLHRLLRTINMESFKNGCQDLGLEFIEYMGEQTSEENLNKIHHYLLEIDILSGYLVSKSGQKFNIIGGIPDIDVPVSEK